MENELDNTAEPVVFTIVAAAVVVVVVIFFSFCSLLAVMAEWLRRWTRNPMGFPRAGSNPARSGAFYFFYFFFILKIHHFANANCC